MFVHVKRRRGEEQDNMIGGVGLRAQDLVGGGQGRTHVDVSGGQVLKIM